MKETWKPITKFEKEYKISNYGNVLSLPRNTTSGKILKPSIKKSGYKSVVLSKDGKLHYFMVHRLVTLAFIDNPNNLPTVNHKDGNKLNNLVSNLEWCSHSDQLKHGHRLGLMNHQGVNHSRHKLTDKQVLKIYGLATTTKLRQYEIAKMFNISQYNVSLIKRKMRWQHILSKK